MAGGKYGLWGSGQQRKEPHFIERAAGILRPGLSSQWTKPNAVVEERLPFGVI